MPLDWERFKKVLELNNKNDRHQQLMTIVHHVDFLTSFLGQLSKELKECKTAVESVERFPVAGPLLTFASTHPYIGYTPIIAELLIICMIEYSKIDLDSDTNISLDSTTLNNKSILWCIIRLRRLISVARNKEKKSDTYKLIQQISSLIDTKGDQLNAEKISKLTDTCLGLIHEKEAYKIIEKLVNCAFADASAQHRPDPILSDQFVYQLVVDDDTNHTLRKHYLNYWPDDLKIKLLENYNDLLEIELLNLKETYILENNYTPLDNLYKQLTQNKFIQLLQLSPFLSQQSLQKLAEYITQFKNWRLVRLGQCVTRCLNTTKLSRACGKVVENATFQHTEAGQVHDALINYIYGQGSHLDIHKRRNEAWCLALSFTRFIWYCVYQLVEWCKKDNEPWTSKMEDILVWINWMVYPSLDIRESENLSFLRHWIQSSQGNQQRLYEELPNVWHNLLNSNGIILACFVTSIFFSLHVEQQISLVKSIYAKPESTHGTTKNNNSCLGLTYMLLDYLNDIEKFHANYYPPLTFDLNQIKGFVNKTYF